MKKFPSVVVMHNVPAEDALESQAEVIETAEAVCEALGKLQVDYRVAGIKTLHDVTLAMRAGRAPVVFNLVEEVSDGILQYNLVPSVCEAFGKQVTGSDTASLLLTQDKWLTKCLLKGAGIGVSEGMLCEPGAAPVQPQFDGPYFVKPAATDASEGIEAGCVFPEYTGEMTSRIRSLHERFRQPVLVEQFVGSREFNVSIVEEEDGPVPLPPAEIEFRGVSDPFRKIVDYAAKWYEGSPEDAATVRRVPARIPEDLARRLQETALKVYRVTGCRDYARVDMRWDEKKIYVLEVNGNPDISPTAGFAAALKASGRSYEGFVELMVQRAARRAGWVLDQPVQAAGGSGEFTVRRTWKKDIPFIMSFLAETGFFREDEVETAREVITDALGAGEAGHYQSWTCCDGDVPAGWLCCGATPCTIGTYDIYWIVVDPRMQRRGIGRLLISRAEEFILEHGGRNAVIETSGRPAYEATRGFYHRMGYETAARLKDFYDAGDDKVVYMKKLPGAAT